MLDEQLLTIARSLPKIELHRHWEASMRLETLVEIAAQSGIEMPEYDVETLRPFVQMMPDEVRSKQHFLGKFATLRQFYRSSEVISRISREIVEDAADDNVKYMELRFTPRALCNITNMPIHEVVELVCAVVEQAAKDNDIQVRLIVSMNRHEGLDVGELVLEAALAYHNRGVVGVDLAGDERFPATPFRSIFQRAKTEGLCVTIHAGEWEGAASIWDAVGNLGADRVGHGVRVLEDPGILNILVKRQVALEVCPSSNYLSGVYDSLDEHPLPQLMQNDVLTTINTDDPIICNVNLTEEVFLAMKHMSLTLADVKQNILQAAQVSFLPEQEQIALVNQFQIWLDEIQI